MIQNRDVPVVYSRDISSTCTGKVAHYPFFDHNPAPLFVVGALCLEVEHWLDANPK